MKPAALAAALLMCATAMAFGGQSATLSLTPAQLVDDYCASCHTAGGRTGGLSLEGFDPAKAASQREISERMIRKLRAGLMPPPGEGRPPQPALDALVTLLEETIDRAGDETPPPRRLLSRLTRAEYTASVKDLLGVDVDASQFLPADTISGGFDNIADVQRASPLLLNGFLRAAAAVSRSAVGEPGSTSPTRTRIFTCRPTRREGAATDCARVILTPLVRRAYRGAASSADVADVMTLFEQGHASGGFDNGIRLAVQAILVSPAFILRVPAGLGDTAVASQLSFFLWGAPPDDALVRAATSGALDTASELVSQARRLLASPRADAMATRFGSQWLRLQDLEDSPVNQLMRQETRLFLADLVRRDASVLDLLTAEYSFLNEPLASHYRIGGVRGAQFRRVSLPPERRGLLGQGSILTSTSLADRTSPVLRGKWVLEVLLGSPPPPPPPNVPALDDSVKPTRGGESLSTRQRMEEHRRNPACASCHKVIDPLGLALEHFDREGRWRVLDNGVPVNTASTLYDGTSITGRDGLVQALLARREAVLRTFTENLLTFAIGRRLDYRDAPQVRAIVAATGKQNYRFSSFILGVISSPAFRAAAQ